MSAAQFKPGQIVRHWTSATESEFAFITEVTNDDPAQYHVVPIKVGDQTTCGEGANEANAVEKL